MSDIVCLEGIDKSFDTIHAVKSLSFCIHRGEIFGLLGPNGAGKTTTIRTIIGMFKPEKGNIAVFGKDLYKNPQLKSKIGYLPEERGLYEKMTALAFVTFFGALHCVAEKEAKNRAKKLLSRLSVDEKAKIESLSKGNKQKVLLAATMVHDPDILILDEPFSGLDPINRVLFKKIFIELKERGKTIILSTHTMPDVEELCDRICLLNKGQRLLYGKLTDIKEEFGKKCINIEGQGDFHILESENYVVEYFDHSVNVYNASPKEILKKLLESGIKISNFRVEDAPLERIYVESVKKHNVENS